MSLRVEKLLSDLRSAAEKATPGPYGFFIGPTWITDLDNVLPENPRFERYEDALFWSHCSPENILALVQALVEARQLAEFYAVPGVQNKDWEWGRGLRNTRMKCTGKKARAFLEKFFPKGET